MSSHFSFALNVELAAPADRVFAVLRDVETWDEWWPQIREIRPYDDASGWVRIRSVLPISLGVTITSDLIEPGSGTLRASLAGDLTGWSQFVVRASSSGGADVAYTQECDVTKRGFVRLSSWTRPVLIANHAWMMRSGMRALDRRANTVS